MIIFATILLGAFLIAILNVATTFWMYAIFFIIFLFMLVKTCGKSMFFLTAPLILAVSSIFLLPFLANSYWQYGFIAFVCLAFGLLLYLRRQTRSGLSGGGENEDRRKRVALRENLALNKSAVLMSLVISFMALFAILENVSLSFWVVLAGFFIVSMFSAREILKLEEKWKDDQKHWKSLLYSLIISFVIFEFAWALSFWPLGFLSLAIILASFFFAFVDSAGQLLSENKNAVLAVLYNAGLALLVIAIISITTKWSII
ncbi:MAG: hypothetical protein V1698_01075 [bacterium]